MTSHKLAHKNEPAYRLVEHFRDLGILNDHVIDITDDPIYKSVKIWLDGEKTPQSVIDNIKTIVPNAVRYRFSVTIKLCPPNCRKHEKSRVIYDYSLMFTPHEDRDYWWHIYNL